MTSIAERRGGLPPIKPPDSRALFRLATDFFIGSLAGAASSPLLPDTPPALVAAAGALTFTSIGLFIEAVASRETPDN